MNMVVNHGQRTNRKRKWPTIFGTADDYLINVNDTLSKNLMN